MISDTTRTVVVSSLGWVDHGSLWIFHASGDREESIPIGDAKYLSLHAGANDYFSVLHHYDGRRIDITVHRFTDPGRAVARAEVDPQGSRVSGDAAPWNRVQTNYAAFYAGPSWSDCALLRIDPQKRSVDVQQFPWYNEDYDKDYQGVVGVTEVPGDALVVVAVQRNSQPVLYDPVTRTKRGSLKLANRGGNPRLFFRRHANELWANDYDTIVKLEAGTWRVLLSQLVQDAAAGTGQFIGDFWFDPDETVCLVARPFSRDIVGLDPKSLKTRFQCKLPGQPLESVLLRDGSVVARDWKTGVLLRGQARL